MIYSLNYEIPLKSGISSAYNFECVLQTFQIPIIIDRVAQKAIIDNPEIPLKSGISSAYNFECVLQTFQN